MVNLPLYGLISLAPVVSDTDWINFVAAYDAYVDDSGNSGQKPVFVLAGGVSTPEKWSRLAEDWRGLLQWVPTLKYLKMSEIARDYQRRAFGEWEQIRLPLFAVLIMRYVEYIVVCSIDVGAYKTVFQNRISQSFQSPYFLATQRIFNMAVENRYRAGLNDQVSFIFDEQRTQMTETAIAWHMLRQHGPRRWRRRLGTPPVWEDEQKMIPLQAADLIAWSARKLIADAETGISPEESVVMKMLPRIEVPTEFEHWDFHRLSTSLDLFHHATGYKVKYEDNKARLNRYSAFRKEGALPSEKS